MGDIVVQEFEYRCGIWITRISWTVTIGHRGDPIFLHEDSREQLFTSLSHPPVWGGLETLHHLETQLVSDKITVTHSLTIWSIWMNAFCTRTALVMSPWLCWHDKIAKDWPPEWKRRWGAMRRGKEGDWPGYYRWVMGDELPVCRPRWSSTTLTTPNREDMKSIEPPTGNFRCSESALDRSLL